MKSTTNNVEAASAAILERVEALLAQIDEEKQRYDEMIAPLKEDIKEIWTEAKDAGLPVKAMRARLRVRNAERAATKKLDEHERDVYDHLRDALGELGAAAAQKAGY